MGHRERPLSQRVRVVRVARLHGAVAGRILLEDGEELDHFLRHHAPDVHADVVGDLVLDVILLRVELGRRPGLAELEERIVVPAVAAVLLVRELLLLIVTFVAVPVLAVRAAAAAAADLRPSRRTVALFAGVLVARLRLALFVLAEFVLLRLITRLHVPVRFAVLAVLLAVVTVARGRT